MVDRLLIVSTSPDFPTLHFELTDGEHLLGRSSKCQFVVNDASVSRKHAEIRVRDGSVTVRDRDSRNGVFIDDARVQTAAVQIGQQLRFGKVSFTLADPTAQACEPDSDAQTARVSVMTAKAPDNEARGQVSHAEQPVLDLIMDGLSEKEIAARLNLSQHTVHNHVRAIYQIFDVHTRAELLAKLLK